MKLSHPAAIKSTALLGSMAIQSWFATLTPRVTADDPAVEPSACRTPSLYMFWHEMMLAPAAYWAKSRIPVLISHHRDGELIAQVIRMLGGQTVLDTEDAHEGAVAFAERRAPVWRGR